MTGKRRQKDLRLRQGYAETGRKVRTGAVAHSSLRWGRPSLAGGVFLIKLRFEPHTLCITLHK